MCLCVSVCALQVVDDDASGAEEWVDAIEELATEGAGCVGAGGCRGRLCVGVGKEGACIVVQMVRGGVQRMCSLSIECVLFPVDSVTDGARGG